KWNIKAPQSINRNVLNSADLQILHPPLCKRWPDCLQNMYALFDHVLCAMLLCGGHSGGFFSIPLLGSRQYVHLNTCRLMHLSNITQSTCKVFVYSLLIQHHAIGAFFRLGPGEKARMEKQRRKPCLAWQPGEAGEQVRDTIIFEMHPPC